MVDSKKFWDSRAKSYAKSPVGDEDTYKEKLKITQRYLDTNSIVYEFGCGTGTTALHHAPFVRRVLATDISGNMIDIASTKAKAASITNVEFQCSTLENLEAADGSFDMVMAHNILHLLENPQEAINTSYRLLKPGGTFVTSTVCLGDSLSLWRVLLVIGRVLRKVPYVNVLKRETLKHYFDSAGFDVVLEWKRTKMAAFIILKKPLDPDYAS